MERNLYKLINEPPDALEAEVQKQLDEGWSPLGGPSFYKKQLGDTMGFKEVRGVQAMYKCPPEPAQPPPTREEFIEMAMKDQFSRLGEVIEEKPVIDVKAS